MEEDSRNEPFTALTSIDLLPIRTLLTTQFVFEDELHSDVKLPSMNTLKQSGLVFPAA